jgi:ABC-type glycerol-3-phosphate transport system substrate-binding protein
MSRRTSIDDIVGQRIPEPAPRRPTRRGVIAAGGTLALGTALAGRYPNATVAQEGTPATPAAGGDLTDLPPVPTTPISIKVDGGPGEEAADEEKQFYQDIVGQFQTMYPNVEIEMTAGGYDPQAFAAKVAGGTLEDGFGTFFTEPQNFIRQGILADITNLITQWGAYDDLVSEPAKTFQDANGRIYGFPTDIYALSLTYNRSLFESAGLDPSSPPTTWEELREVSRQITEQTGTPGFSFLSTNNQGGWHFTTMLYTYGADPVRQEGDRYIAQFNSDVGVQILEYLKALRWEDNSLTEQQLLDQTAASELIATGQVAMTIGGIPANLIQQYEADINDYGLGAVPQGGGNAVLGGGYGYVFNAKSSPDKIAAAVDWFLYRAFDPSVFQADLESQIARELPVGFPKPPLFTGALQQQRDAAVAAVANVPVELYQPYIDAMANIAVKSEPTGFDVQRMYGSLDPAIQAVLTDENADPKALLDTATQEFQAILDQG